MKSTRTYVALALATVLTTSLAACSSDSKNEEPAASDTTTTTTDSSPTEESDAPVTIKVVSLTPGSSDEAFAAFDEQVKAFEAKYKNITVESQEYEWLPDKFAADLAGGTLPDVFQVPFTDGRGLIENGQLADIDALFKELPYAGDFNPNVLQAGQGADGKVYAIPYSAYGVGLHYNRTLFKEAGLDPDKPPTTWDEVRADAKAIAEKTGQAGYSMMTQGNTGGWQLTVATYAHGGRIQVDNGDGTYTSTANNDGTKKALEFLKTLRWEDNSMGSNFLYDWGSINQDFAAGKIGMYTSGNDVYTNMVMANNINPDDYGLTVIPLDGADAGVLGGGNLAAVSAKADDAVKAAAMKWIDFYYMGKQIDKDSAVANAKIQAASNQPVGTPALPIFSKELYNESQEWIKDYINVPLAQMTGYTDKIFDLPLINEPTAKTQDSYAELDPVVQAVLTDKNANIDSLLSTADKNIQRLLDR